MKNSFFRMATESIVERPELFSPLAEKFGDARCFDGERNERASPRLRMSSFGRSIRPPGLFGRLFLNGGSVFDSRLSVKSRLTCVNHGSLFQYGFMRRKR